MLSFRSAYFENESPRRLDKNVLIDRLATRLRIAANGRILFVDREHADMVEKERAPTREGVADAGTAGLTNTVAGADYHPNGRIASLDSRAPGGAMERYMNIALRMTDPSSTTGE